ncbi:MAG: hypothetical protein QM802_02285 [Agriterribacter sp.]
MEILNKKLKKAPSVTQLELLMYAAAQDKPVALKIVTNAGCYYWGYPLNVGNTKVNSGVMFFQLIDERNGGATGILHIDIASVESVEIPSNDDAIQILSLGSIFPAQSYDVSGKLDVKRAFKTLADTINQAYQLQLKGPEMELPDDGNALNRIIKLTQVIQQTITEVLKEEDARISWQAKFEKLIFSDKESLEVTGEGSSLHIHFPFSDVDAPEISAKQLSEKLMSAL